MKELFDELENSDLDTEYRKRYTNIFDELNENNEFVKRKVQASLYLDEREEPVYFF